jgi:type I restriction enzyme S subunit
MSEVTNIPQLRFPEFSDEWEEKKLGDVTSWSSGGTPSKAVPHYWNGKIPWISASSMKGKYFIDSKLKITLEGLKAGSKLAPKNSILLLVRGSMLFKKIPFGLAETDVAFNQDVKCLKVLGESTFDFIYYWFCHSENHLLNMVTGTGIGAGKLETSYVQLMNVNIPEFLEQEKIAAFLTTVDNKIEQLSKKQELLKEYKKGLMQQIFSQATRFKADDGCDFPDWEEKKLGDVSVRGTSNISANQLEDNNGDYKIYGAAGHLKNIDFYTEEDCYVAIVKDGAGVGRIMLLESKTSVLGTLAIIKAKQGNDINFLYWLIQTINFRKYVVGSTIPHIYYRDYQAEKLRIPSLSEQTKIANFLSFIDSKIEQVGKQLDESKQFKKALLQQMFV